MMYNVRTRINSTTHFNSDRKYELSDEVTIFSLPTLELAQKLRDRLIEIYGDKTSWIEKS